MSPFATLRRDRRDPGFRAPVKPVAEQEHGSWVGRRLICAACSHPVTTEEQRIDMKGHHEHRCVNPDGVTFHIGCFRQAPGCVTHGVPTAEFTWFPSFAWNYALCAGCATLLGWRYHGGDAATFFGLILNRLATERSH